jgi:hypothetical protein
VSRVKKLISLIIILIVLVTTGCSKKDIVKHNYTFKGENESWTAEYNIDGTETFIKDDDITHVESECQKEFSITYKNNISELSSIKNIEISYKSSISGGEIVEDYNDGTQPEKTYKIQSSSTGGAIESPDDTIEVTVNIDGNIEVFELKNEQ